MKVVILAGGFGTRLSEHTDIKPKPMVEIGEHPIIWHIMKHFAHYDFREFIIALGYKGEVIKRYFLDYHTLNSDMAVDLNTGHVQFHERQSEDWKVHLVDTGLPTQTGGRILRLKRFLQNETFMVTYGDGVSDVNLRSLLEFHKAHRRVATVTAVRPPARFGGLVFEGELVSEFTEKSQVGEGWINGGYQIYEPEIFNYISEDASSLEMDVLEHLATKSQLGAYRHHGYWQCMDTLRDIRLMEQLWRTDQPPWKVWH